MALPARMRRDLDAMAADLAPAAHQWWADQHARALTIEAATERRQALAELREERDRRRLTGLHFDTRSAIVAFYVREEMDARGWRSRRWPPVRSGEASMAGRRWGSPNRSEGEFDASLAVHLPDGDGELLRRATWRVSAPATRRLQQIGQIIGPVPRAVRQERDQLVATVITTGDVIRAAVERALDSWRSPTDTDGQ